MSSSISVTAALVKPLDSEILSILHLLAPSTKTFIVPSGSLMSWSKLLTVPN